MSNVPLQIYKLENGKYRIDINAINSILDKVGDRNVAIYSINGTMGMGKSFMLNFFLRYLISEGSDDWINTKLKSLCVKKETNFDPMNYIIPSYLRTTKILDIKGFEFRGGAERNTTGILMWSQPFIVRKPNGKEVAVLLMDTQGAFGPKSTMQEDSFIFTLSTLLSSFIIFNVQQQLDEQKLQVLQYFASYARLADESNSDEPFQKLLFLIRDWQFTEDYDYGYYDDDHSINGKNYKKDVLNPKDDSKMEIRFIREMILSSFDNVSCFLMPFPGRKITHDSKYDPQCKNPDFIEFKDYLKTFVPRILSPENIVEKKIGGSYITGNKLKVFVEKWALMFDQLPNVKTFYDATGETLIEIAKSGAIDNYNKRMKEILQYHFGADDKVLDIFHSQTVRDSIELYKCFKGFANKNTDENIGMIQNELNAHYEHYREINRKNQELNSIMTRFRGECERLREVNKNHIENIPYLKVESLNKNDLLKQIDMMENRMENIEKNKLQKIKKLQEQQYSINPLITAPKPKRNMSSERSLSDLAHANDNYFGEKSEENQFDSNLKLKFNEINSISEKYDNEIEGVTVEFRNANTQLITARREQKARDAPDVKAKERCVIQ